MKPPARGIEPFLAKLPAEIQAVLFFGPDQGLVNERAKKLVQSRVPDLADAFNYAELTDESLKANPTRLAEEMAAMSFTGGQRVVYLRDLSDKYAELVAEALKDAMPTTLLVVSGDDMTPRSPLRQLFEKEKHLAAIACYHDEAQDIASLVRSKLQQEGIQAARDAVDYAARQLGNDRMVTSSEIEKLVLFAGPGGTLSLEDAMAVLNASQDQDVDDLLFAMSTGDAKSLDALFAQQLREGAQPVMLLRAASRHFQRLYEVRMAIEERARGMDEAISALKPAVFFRDIPKMQRAAQRLRAAQVAQIMEWLAQAELACKSSGAIAPALTCGRLFLRIASLNASAKAA